MSPDVPESMHSHSRPAETSKRWFVFKVREKIGMAAEMSKVRKKNEV